MSELLQLSQHSTCLPLDTQSQYSQLQFQAEQADVILLCAKHAISVQIAILNSLGQQQHLICNGSQANQALSTRSYSVNHICRACQIWSSCQSLFPWKRTTQRPLWSPPSPHQAPVNPPPRYAKTSTGMLVMKRGRQQPSLFVFKHNALFSY